MRNEKAVQVLQHYLDIAEDYNVEIKELEILVTEVEDLFEAKKGMFIVVNNEAVYQCRNDFNGQNELHSERDGVIVIKSIREASTPERFTKIEEFKDRGYICGDDGLWVEMKLEDVYCVARSKADFCKVYGVNPELVSNGADMDIEDKYIHIWEGLILNCMDNDGEQEVSIEKFIELIKKQK